MNEFEEIGHSGGIVTFNVKTGDEGGIVFNVEYRHTRPTPMVMIGIYALPNGVPVGNYSLGLDENEKRPPGSWPVFVQSDSEGKFGHRCPRCGGYWRSGPLPNVCAYCALKTASFNFLSVAQRIYVKHYCRTLADAIDQHEDGTDLTVEIDMNVVAEAAGTDSPKPEFYVAEERQQHRFTCSACNEFNDVLGTFAYCSKCGTRNDLDVLTTSTAPGIRDRLNAGGSAEAALRDIVSSFDTVAGQYGRQLLERVPMTPRRRTRLEKQRFHSLEDAAQVFKGWFDIDILAGLTDGQQAAVRLAFHRRHLYEHNGGEVDEKYLNESGDKSVRLKQRLNESGERMHDLLSQVTRIARNLHDGFHQIFPPIPEPIKYNADRKARSEAYGKEQGQ